jgi:hypothetical protein
MQSLRELRDSISHQLFPSRRQSIVSTCSRKLSKMMPSGQTVTNCCTKTTRALLIVGMTAAAAGTALTGLATLACIVEAQDAAQKGEFTSFIFNERVSYCPNALQALVNCGIALTATSLCYLAMRCLTPQDRRR